MTAVLDGFSMAILDSVPMMGGHCTGVPTLLYTIEYHMIPLYPLRGKQSTLMKPLRMKIVVSEWSKVIKVFDKDNHD